jgi:hypothetical protein
MKLYRVEYSQSGKEWKAAIWAGHTKDAAKKDLQDMMYSDLKNACLKNSTSVNPGEYWLSYNKKRNILTLALMATAKEKP